MNFNTHSNLAGKHAFLSPSKYHWVNYDEDKLDRVFFASMQAQRGNELHEFASRAIKLRQKLEDTNQTVNMYVNDAIGFKMTPEQVLYYSENAFGTADAISYRQGTLRIHDLKTGEVPASETQLKIYAAFFCLEYRIKPFEIGDILLRIYQNDDVLEFIGDPDEIYHIMDRVVTFDKRIEEMKVEVLS